MYKYPRIQHIPGSKSDYDDLISPVFPAGEFLVFEKFDGANLGISIQNGVLKLQNRGQYLENKRPHPQWDAAKNWAYSLYDNFTYAMKGMDSDTTVFGEWLFAKHSILYDRLPSYFIVFDVYSGKRFLSYQESKQFAEEAGLVFSPLISETNDIQWFVNNFKHEPLYSNSFEGFIFRKKSSYSESYKLVLDDFTAGISTHWFNSKLVRNRISYE